MLPGRYLIWQVEHNHCPIVQWFCWCRAWYQTRSVCKALFSGLVGLSIERIAYVQLHQRVTYAVWNTDLLDCSVYNFAHNSDSKLW